MHFDQQEKGMNMAISVALEEKLFRPIVNGVRIVFFNKFEDTILVPTDGSVVVVRLNTGTLYNGDVGGVVGEAMFYDITAYYNGNEYYSTFLRMTRWVSGKLRWRVYHRLSAKIRRATTYVAR